MNLPAISTLPITVKNYQELCSLLEIPATGGLAKQNNLRRIDNNLIYKKIGNSFRILGLKNEQYVEFQRAARTNSIWIEPVSLVLLDHLVKYTIPGEVSFLYMTTPELSALVGLTNSSYAEKYYMEESLYGEVFKKETRIFTRNVLDRTFSNLAARKILDISTVYVDIDRDTFKYVEFSKEDQVHIVEAYGTALKHFNLTTESGIYTKGRADIKKFYNYINALLKFEFGIQYHMKAKRFGFTENIIARRDDFKEEFELVIRTKKQTNSTAQAKLLDRLEKILPTIVFIDKGVPFQEARQDFIDGFKELVNIFIDIRNLET